VQGSNHCPQKRGGPTFRPSKRLIQATTERGEGGRGGKNIDGRVEEEVSPAWVWERSFREYDAQKEVSDNPTKG